MDKLEQNIDMKIFGFSSDHKPANFDAKYNFFAISIQNKIKSNLHKKIMLDFWEKRLRFVR